ncbi:MAG: hypothetical protein OQL09_07110 [Gammaproteobacteria bacterium]|nr:hypothetical protein [Gammaproteobacteria bacterium]
MKHSPDSLQKINRKQSGNKAISTSTAQEIVKKPVSMHEDVPVWYDCCSCEVEPYWLEAMEADSHKKSAS